MKPLLLRGRSLPAPSVSPFVKAVGYLAGGQGIATLLPFLAAPILGRLYVPLDYSGLVLYVAIANIVGVVATMQFHQAIVVEGRLSAAVALLWLCLIIALATGFAVGFLVFGYWLFFGASGPGWPWLFLLPASAVQLGIVSASTLFANHLRNYRFLARVQVLQVGVTVAVSIVLGFYRFGSAGLFAGYFAGQVVQTAVHIWLLHKFGRPWRWPGLARLVALGRKYRRFPVFTVPSEFILAVLMQMPLFALNMLGATAMIGAFGRARQIVSIPVNVVGGAVGTVFMREAAEQYRTTGSCRTLLLRTGGGLLLVGIVPFAALLLFAPEMFRVYLGPKWGEAGEIARVLAPMLLIRFVASPIATVFWVTGHQRLELAITAVSFAVMPALMLVCYATYGTAFSIVVGYSLGYAALYAIYFLFALKVSTR